MADFNRKPWSRLLEYARIQIETCYYVTDPTGKLCAIPMIQNRLKCPIFGHQSTENYALFDVLLSKYTKYVEYRKDFSAQLPRTTKRPWLLESLSIAERLGVPSASRSFPEFAPWNSLHRRCDHNSPPQENILPYWRYVREINGDSFRMNSSG